MDRIIKLMDRFVDDILAKIEAIGPLVLREIDELILASKQGGPKVRSIKLSLSIPGAEDTTEALERIRLELEAIA